jgi:hypothetical protein
VSKSEGFLDDAGLLWFSQRDTFDSAGVVIAKQTFEYDDAKKIMVSSVSQLDPKTGQVLNTYKQDMPYTPPEEPEEDEDADDGGGAEAK